MNAARVANSVLQGALADSINPANGVDLLRLLTQHATVPAIQVKADIAENSVLDRAAALRLRAELAHDHQQLEYAIEVFRRNNRETFA
jgi:hypothetical protein